MTVNKPKRIYPYIILWIPAAFVLSITFIQSFGAYEKYREMEGTGLAFFEALVEFPVMLFLFLTVGGITSFVMWKRNYNGRKIFLWSLANMAIIFVISFAFKVLQLSIIRPNAAF